MPVEFRAVHPLFAAEVLGVDLASGLDEAAFAPIRAAFEQHSVLVFRNQHLSERGQVEFSRRFGELEIHFLKQYLHPEHPELLLVSNILENGKPVGVVDAGQYWHTDTSYWQKPAYASLLYSVEIPVVDGRALGDTMFTSTAAAYDALPEATKRRIDGRRGIHRYLQRHKKTLDGGAVRKELTAEQRAVPDAIHPIVRTHPATGRKCLYVNEGFTVGIEGMPDAEAVPLLAELFAHCTKPEFVYRHRWQVGDLVMWDNIATLHNAVADYKPSMRRLLRKATVMGTVPA